MRYTIEQLESRTLLTVVSLGMSVTEISEGSATPAIFTVSRDNTAGDMVVRYRVGGSASAADFAAPLPGFITIPNGSSSVNISVQPLSDGVSETHETLTIQLLQPDGASYTLGQYDQGTLRIVNTSGTTQGVYRTVGPGKTYATPSAAIAAAANGNIIDIWPDSDGIYYGDTATINKSNLTIRGIGLGRVKVHVNPAIYNLPNKKGIWAFSAGYTNLTIENFDFQGARISDADGHNGAGLRLQGDTWTVRNCYFYGNQMGILASGSAASNTLIEYSEFVHNGLNSDNGNNHNVYIGSALGTFTFQYNFSTDSSIGHLVKSRARTNYILYNRLYGSATESYEINLPEGGKSYVIGNIIRQAPGTDNAAIIDYASEVAPLTGDFLYVINNTLINNRSSGGTYVQGAKLPAGFNFTVKNNIFAGPVSSYITTNTGVYTASNNVTGTVAALKFVNSGASDYHLAAGSPAINAGTNPGSSSEQGYNLSPTKEYVTENGMQPRLVAGALDAGGYELFVPPATPPIPVLQPASDGGVLGDNRTNDNTPTLNLTLSSPWFRLYVDGVMSGGDRAAASSITVPALTQGLHTLAVMALDAQGNVSAMSPVLNLTIDTSAPAVNSWASALDHARGVGTVALAIPDDATFSEGRNDGLRNIVVSFSEALASFLPANVKIAGNSTTGAVNLASYTIDPTLSPDKKTATIRFRDASNNLVPLPDYARYLIRLTGLTDLAGNPLAGDADRVLTALKGDASGDLRVNSTDLSRVQANTADPISAGNLNQVRADISQDGRVNSTDLSRVQAASGRDARGITTPIIPTDTQPLGINPIAAQGVTPAAGVFWSSRPILANTIEKQQPLTASDLTLLPA